MVIKQKRGGKQSTVSPFQKSLLLACNNRQVQRPTKLSNIIILYKDVESVLECSFALYYLFNKKEFDMALVSASAVPVTLAQVRVKYDGTREFITDTHGEQLTGDAYFDNVVSVDRIRYASQIKHDTGGFVYYEPHFSFSVLHNNVRYLQLYCDTNLDRIKNTPSQAFVDLAYKAGKMPFPYDSKHQVFDTSFTFIPEGALKYERLPASYCKIRQINKTTVRGVHMPSEVPLRVYGNETCPVIGYLMNENGLRQITNKYSDHGFYQMYMEHVLWVLYHLTENVRGLCYNGSKMTSKDLPPPMINASRLNKPTVMYVGDNIVTLHNTVFKARLDFDWGQHLVPWSSIHANMKEIVQELNNNMPSRRYDTHKVSHLELKITMTTYTIKPLHTDTTNFVNKMLVKTEPSDILCQHISVRGMYYGNSNYICQPQSELVFVTTNRGWYEANAEISNPAMIMMHLGYGLPLQTNIAETKKPMFGHNYSSIPSDVTSESISKGIANIVRKPQDSARGRLDQMWSSVVNQLTDPEIDVMFSSWERNFQRNNLKQVDELDKINYHYMSNCSRHMTFVAKGKALPNPFIPIRLISVVIGLPQGNFSQDGFAPAWDSKDGVKPFTVSASLARGAGFNPSSDHGQMMAASPFQIVDEEISIDEIIAAASRPSIFDNELYM